MTTSWHAVYTQPRMELWARSNLWERGVVNLVCRGSEPSTVHHSIIDAIRQREDDLGIIQLERSFGRGEPLRICEGPFVDLPAIFECESDDRRIVVLLNMLGRQTRVRIAREQVGSAT